MSDEKNASYWLNKACEYENKGEHHKTNMAFKQALTLDQLEREVQFASEVITALHILNDMQ